MRKAQFIIVFYAVVLTGCATASVARYPNAQNLLPTNPANVAVYTNFPPTPYEVIGEVAGNGAPAASWDSVAGEMRKKAADIGGDAVVVLVQDTPFVGSINTPGSIQGGTTGYGNSSGNFNAYGSGNNVYGNYGGSGTYQSTSNYTYTPPTSTPMYGKFAKGVVIKYKRQESATVPASPKNNLSDDDKQSVNSWLNSQGVKSTV